jgi:hypothetical protein
MEILCHRQQCVHIENIAMEPISSFCIVVLHVDSSAFMAICVASNNKMYLESPQHKIS